MRTDRDLSTPESWLLARDATREEQLRALWAMSAAERVARMRAGHLSRDQLFAWAARRPGGFQSSTASSSFGCFEARSGHVHAL